MKLDRSRQEKIIIAIISEIKLLCLAFEFKIVIQQRINIWVLLLKAFKTNGISILDCKVKDG